jgi:hypothetical protein
LKEIDDLQKELDKSPSLVGARGLGRRIWESAAGQVGVSTGGRAHAFATDVRALVLRLPEALQLKGRTGAGAQYMKRLDDIANVLELGVNAQTAKEQLNALRQIVVDVSLDPQLTAKDDDTISSSESVETFKDPEKEARYQAWKKSHDR